MPVPQNLMQAVYPATRLVPRKILLLITSLWLASCAVVSRDDSSAQQLSESQQQNCREVGLSRSECLLVATEIDRLREAADFDGLKAAYEEVRPQPPEQIDDMRIKACRPRIESSAGAAKSCNKAVVTERDVSLSF